nr:MAG TPA: hypothetical protein [Caudoviricetes sp.]
MIHYPEKGNKHVVEQYVEDTDIPVFSNKSRCSCA